MRTTSQWTSQLVPWPRWPRNRSLNAAAAADDECAEYDGWDDNRDDDDADDDDCDDHRSYLHACDDHHRTSDDCEWHRRLGFVRNSSDC
jgi:hypothetical protein